MRSNLQGGKDVVLAPWAERSEAPRLTGLIEYRQPFPEPINISHRSRWMGCTADRETLLTGVHNPPCSRKVDLTFLPIPAVLIGSRLT
jgi:hypothetical protein